MSNLLLIASLAGERVAFAAHEVESVVEIGEITPVPHAPAYIVGLAALRSRTLTVVDCRALLDAGCAATPPRDAVVATVAGHSYAFVVDRAEDVVEADGPEAPLPPGVAQGWFRIARAFAPAAGGLVAVLNPAAIIGNSSS